MNKIKRFLCVVFAVITIFSACVVSASAASPLNVSISTCKEKYSTLDCVKVTVSVKNTSSRPVKNVVISSKSNELVTVSPSLGKTSKSEIKAGKTYKYTYFVLLRRTAIANKSAIMQSAMFTQHLWIRPQYFSKTSGVSSGSKTSKSKTINMTAAKANLTVTVYYGLGKNDFAKAKKLIKVPVTSSNSTEVSRTTTSSRSNHSNNAKEASEDIVYIARSSNNRIYHSISDCCGMINPISMSKSEAIKQNYRPCQDCCQ